MMKVCESCKIEKEISSFGKDVSNSDNKSNCCKKCKNLRCQKSQNLYRSLNLAKFNRFNITNKTCHKCKSNKTINNFCRHLCKRDGFASDCLKCRSNKQTKRHALKLHSDPLYKLKYSLSKRVRQAIKSNSKSALTMELVGAPIEVVKSHLQSKFQDGMSWENHGLYGWHIDHIRPCASFDLTKPEEQRKCFHYTNLQPLWAKDNLSKSDKY